MAIIVIPEEELDLCEIFADETCTTQHRYMAIGAVVVSASDKVTAIEELTATKTKLGLLHELKWEYVRSKNVERYRQIIDAYFDLSRRDVIHFHSLVIDTTKLNHRRYNGGDRDVGFSKFVFQLLLKFSRIYGPKIKAWVHLDARTTRQKLGPVRDMLNFKARNDFKMAHFPYRRIHFRNSKDVLLLQMADILVGAIGFSTNGKERTQPPLAAKTALANHIAERAGLKTLAQQTPISKQTFTIWHMRLKTR